MNIQVIHACPDFFVVDKPAGVPVQAQSDCVGIMPRLQQQIDCGPLWLVHRLDKVTSGLLLLARSQQSASKLSQAFAERLVSKYYLALGSKSPQKKQGLIWGDMHKSRSGSWKLTKQKSNPAVTQFQSIGTGSAERLYLLRPLTGKTHQLRVAMRSNSAPILGDERYGGLPSDRTYLHAFGLSFEYDGRSFAFTCPPTQGEYFTRAAISQLIEGWRTPWLLPWSVLPQIPRVNDTSQSIEL